MAIPLLAALGLFLALPSPDVLHLSDGHALAGRIQREDSRQIEIATLDGIEKVDRSKVLMREGVESLRDLYRRTRPEAEQAGSRGLFALASWCRRKGLGKEILDTLDRLLEIDPEHAASRELLTSLAHCDGLSEFLGGFPEVPIEDNKIEPRGFQTVLSRFRSRGAARRALMVDRLAGVPPTPGTRKTALAILKRGRASSRLLAADLLARWQDSTALRALLAATITDGDPEVRHESALAVRTYRHPDAFRPLARVLSHSRSSYRAAAINALATLGDPHAVGALIANLGPLPAPAASSSTPRNHIFVGRRVSLVTDFDVDIASNAVIANPNVTTAIEGALLDVRVIGVSSRRSAGERRRTANALRRLTGVDLGTDDEAWRRWWSVNSHDVLAAGGLPAAR